VEGRYIQKTNQNKASKNTNKNHPKQKQTETQKQTKPKPKQTPSNDVTGIFFWPAPVAFRRVTT